MGLLYFFQFLMSLGSVSVLVIHLLVQPYQKRHVNIIEAFVLMNLVTVTVVFLNPTTNEVPGWLGTLLLLLPYFYGIFYISWALVHYA